MRELQSMGLTYGVTGKGTFVHPEAPRRIKVNIDGQPDPDEGDLNPEMSPDLALHLQYRDTIVDLTLKMISTRDKREQADFRAQLGLMQAIYDGQARELKDEIAAYQARLAYAAAKASPPTGTAEEPPADESPKPSRRSPKK